MRTWLLSLAAATACGRINFDPLDGELAIDAASVPPIDTPQPACVGVDVMLDPSSGACYRLFRSNAAWQVARDTCAASWGHLVDIGTVAEHDLVDVLTAGVSVWIGASDLAVEASWIWTDGMPLTFTRWDTGQPNSASEDCAEMRLGSWNDAECTAAQPFVCERPPGG